MVPEVFEPLKFYYILFLFSNPQELDLLSQLYGLFQKFIRFDDRFRETLWADIDLEASFREVTYFFVLNIFWC